MKMQLTETDRKQIEDWIKEKCGQMRCTCCGYANFTIINVATLPIAFNLHSTRFFYAQGIPQVAIACTNCGHMLFFNTGIMGFQPDEPPPVDVPPADDNA